MRKTLISLILLTSTTALAQTDADRPLVSVAGAYDILNTDSLRAEFRAQVDHLGGRYSVLVRFREFMPDRPQREFPAGAIKPPNHRGAATEYAVLYGRRFRLPGGSITLSTGVGMTSYVETEFTFSHTRSEEYEYVSGFWLFFPIFSTGTRYIDVYSPRSVKHYDAYLPVDLDICFHLTEYVGIDLRAYTAIGPHSTSGVNIGLTLGVLE